ncbi:porin [Pelistega sp. NLN82]|uniref:Porin n=1 Tax=Pelistega ratti TaxID=2652177 RepID=A0A6L9Y6P5_9BURK|nr:porin [Pelistega ratti]NEN76132.1 porin [Pelistega ratti]
MKKTLLVSALAVSFAGVAHAESSVTLYGIVDAGISYTQTKTTGVSIVTGRDTDGNDIKAVGTKKTRNFGLKNGAKQQSRFGLKGIEELGNGTAAIFQLESGFDLETGSTGKSLFNRRAIIGLTGESWGTLTIGRQHNVADDILAPIDPFGTDWGQAGANSTFGGSISAVQTPTIKYLSPNFEGFKFGLAVSGSDNKTKETVNGVTTNRKKQEGGVSVGLGYDNGPLALAATFDYSRSKGTNLLNDDGAKIDNYDSKAKAWAVGAAYDFDVVKLHLGYGQQRDGFVADVNNYDTTSKERDVNKYGLFDATQQVAHIIYGGADISNKGLRAQSWFGGFTVPVADNGKALFSYQGGRIKHNANKFGGARVNTHIYSLGYQHDLSKRTNVYVLGSYGEAKSSGYERKVKSRTTQAIVGLQHHF